MPKVPTAKINEKIIFHQPPFWLKGMRL